MRKPIICLVLALALAFVGFVGVPRAVEGVVQVVLFGLLVVFVVLMIMDLAEGR